MLKPVVELYEYEYIACCKRGGTMNALVMPMDDKREVDSMLDRMMRLQAVMCCCGVPMHSKLFDIFFG